MSPKITQKDLESFKGRGFQVAKVEKQHKDPIIGGIQESASVIANAVSSAGRDIDKLVEAIKQAPDYTNLVTELKKSLDNLVKKDGNAKILLIPIEKLAKTVHESILYNTAALSKVLKQNANLMEEQSKQLDMLVLTLKNQNSETAKKKWEMITVRDKEGFLSKVNIKEL